MSAFFDVDLLRTFVAIVDSGSFSKAASVIHKTQSAVSFQVKRLEERVGYKIFAREGRASHLTEEGEQLLDYARRIVKLNVEAVAAFSDPNSKGLVRLGIPDDYADSYLPDIVARFARNWPSAQMSIICEPSANLLERIDANELDLAIVTARADRDLEVLRREQLLWVASKEYIALPDDPLPLALGRSGNAWRQIALERLAALGRSHRLVFISSSAVSVNAAARAGFAITVIPESGLRPWMRVLKREDGLPELPPCAISLALNPHESSRLTKALAREITSSLDNLHSRDTLASLLDPQPSWLSSEEASDS